MLNGLKIRVPEDISIIGFGDSSMYPDCMQVPLTTISQSCEKMGAQAVKSLIEMMNDKPISREFKTSTKLIERASVKSLKNPAQGGINYAKQKLSISD